MGLFSFLLDEKVSLSEKQQIAYDVFSTLVRENEDDLKRLSIKTARTTGLISFDTPKYQVSGFVKDDYLIFNLFSKGTMVYQFSMNLNINIDHPTEENYRAIIGEHLIGLVRRCM